MYMQTILIILDIWRLSRWNQAVVKKWTGLCFALSALFCKDSSLYCLTSAKAEVLLKLEINRALHNYVWIQKNPLTLSLRRRVVKKQTFNKLSANFQQISFVAFDLDVTIDRKHSELLFAVLTLTAELQTGVLPD